MSFGVLNLRFANTAGDSLTPDGNIRIALDSVELGYKLWLLNGAGEWVEKSSSAGPVIGTPGLLGSRVKRQSGATDLGGFDDGDIGQWINIDKVPSDATRCFVKTRVFEDVSFTSEVVINGVDQYQPKFLLKFGSSAPFQGLNLYRPPPLNPRRTCFEVRCGTPPDIQGFVSVLTEEIIGNGQSVPFPAVPFS